MPFEMNVDLSELRGLSAAYPEIVRDEARRTMLRVTARVEKSVVEKTPKAYGQLAGSIHGEVLFRGDEVLSRTGTPLEYGEVVEKGRRPGKKAPPTEPLVWWAMRKLGLNEEEAREIAWPMARMIGKWGIEGTHMFEDTLTELDPWIMAELTGIVDRVIRRAEPWR